MTRREQTAALLTDVEQYLGCKGSVEHRRSCACRNGMELFVAMGAALAEAVKREDAIRKVASEILANDGALEAVADGSPIPDIFLGREDYDVAVAECEIGKKLLAILDGDEVVG